VAMSLPVSASQSRAVLSHEALPLSGGGFHRRHPRLPFSQPSRGPLTKRILKHASAPGDCAKSKR
jgi:hypothetical protein